MLKKWAIIIGIIALLIVGCILENNYVNSTFDEMTVKLGEYQLMLKETEENINTSYNIDYLNYLHQNFHEKEKVLKALIWHTGLKDVEVGLSRIITYTKENDFTEAMAETKALYDYCKHYSLDFKITPENIL